MTETAKTIFTKKVLTAYDLRDTIGGMKTMRSLRMPAELDKALRTWAEAEGTTWTAVVVRVLAAAVRRRVA